MFLYLDPQSVHRQRNAAPACHAVTECVITDDFHDTHASFANNINKHNTPNTATVQLIASPLLGQRRR